jgi:hypothetical protein
VWQGRRPDARALDIGPERRGGRVRGAGIGAPRASAYAHIYPGPQHVVLTRMHQSGGIALLSPRRAETMREAVCELRRISLPRTPVNRGKRKGRVAMSGPLSWGASAFR